MKVHDGKWWDFILAYPASTPIHKGGGAASGRPPLCGYPHGWMSRLGKQG